MVLGGHHGWHRPHAGQSSSVYRHVERARGLRLRALSPVSGGAVGTVMAMVAERVIGCAADVVSGQAVEWVGIPWAEAVSGCATRGGEDGGGVQGTWGVWVMVVLEWMLRVLCWRAGGYGGQCAVL